MERLTYRDANGEAWYSDVGTEADRLHFIADMEEILGDSYDLDRLRELVEADRDGRCVVLPQKTVFELTWDAGPNCDMICPVNIDGEEQCDHCDKGELCVYERECKQEHLDKIGQTVFLTSESAEATLKGDQHGKQ